MRGWCKDYTRYSIRVGTWRHTSNHLLQDLHGYAKGGIGVDPAEKKTLAPNTRCAPQLFFPLPDSPQQEANQGQQNLVSKREGVGDD